MEYVSDNLPIELVGLKNHIARQDMMVVFDTFLRMTNKIQSLEDRVQFLYDTRQFNIPTPTRWIPTVNNSTLQNYLAFGSGKPELRINGYEVEYDTFDENHKLNFSEYRFDDGAKFGRSRIYLENEYIYKFPEIKSISTTNTDEYTKFIFSMRFANNTPFYMVIQGTEHITPKVTKLTPKDMPASFKEAWHRSRITMPSDVYNLLGHLDPYRNNLDYFLNIHVKREEKLTPQISIVTEVENPGPFLIEYYVIEEKKDTTEEESIFSS